MTTPAPGALRPLRAAAVLARKYLADLARNPAMTLSAAIPVLCSLFFRLVWAEQSGLSPDALALVATAMLYAVMFEALMASSMFVMYAMAEEQEKGALGTLLRCGVTRGQTVAARLASGFAAFAVSCAACCLLLLPDPTVALPIALISIASQLPLILAGAALGLRARTQMSTMTLSVPLFIVGMLPFFLSGTEAAAPLAPYLPNGGAFPFVHALVVGGNPLPALLTALITTALWTAATALLLAWMLRKEQREEDAFGK